MKNVISRVFPLMPLLLLAAMCATADAQILAGTVPVAAAPRVPTQFRVGEKLSYVISFGKFNNAGHAEIAVVSRGVLSGRDAIELRSKVKTVELVEAALFQMDETRTVYVAPDSGLPLFVSRKTHLGLTPQEFNENYLDTPAVAFDLLSLIYKARLAGGAGVFPLFENGKQYSVSFAATSKSERISTDAGAFDTVASSVESDYLAANGFKDCIINFGADSDHVPVRFRMKTSKGIVTVLLSAVQVPSTVAIVTPIPAASRTPVPGPTTKPRPTPTPYIDNQPLPTELGFDLGESLEYAITDKGAPIAGIVLEARERRLYQNRDSLLLTAIVTRTEPGSKLFIPGDMMDAHVDPETLAPQMVESKFSGELSWINATVTFDRRSGTFSTNGGAPVETPMGTHALLSLIYAIRSFNLKPSKDPSNPVNDTRVAVLWNNQPFIFKLRPATSQTITINGEPILAQEVKIATGNDTFDKLGLRIWLSSVTRVPVRFMLGSYQADLVGTSKKPL
jgi:hypothetical protein